MSTFNPRLKQPKKLRPRMVRPGSSAVVKEPEIDFRSSFRDLSVLEKRMSNRMEKNQVDNSALGVPQGRRK